MEPEALAYQLNAGGPVEMFDRLVECVKEVAHCEALDRWLAGRLTTGDIIDLVTRVNVAEPDYVEGEHLVGDSLDGQIFECREGARKGLISDEARAAVTLMYLRGFDPEQIALILVLPVERVRTHIALSHHNRRAREVVALGLAGGLSAVQIAERTGVHRSSVYEILERAGAKLASRTTPDELRDKAVRMRAKGMSYEQIRSITGLSTNVLRKTFQRAAQRGLLPNYGKDRVA